MGDSNRESNPALLDNVDGGWEEDENESASSEADMRASTPDIAAVDSAWGDEDDEEEEEEAEEPLPDEALDPVAYAAAKKAREEREEARRQRRKLRAEAKRQKQKERAEAARQKQKAKQKKKPGARPTPAELAEQTEREAKKRRKDEARKAREEAAAARGVAAEDDALATDVERSFTRKAAPAPRAKADSRAEKIAKSAPPWHLLGLVLLVLLAAAALFAVTRR